MMRSGSVSLISINELVGQPSTPILTLIITFVSVSDKNMHLYDQENQSNYYINIIQVTNSSHFEPSIKCYKTSISSLNSLQSNTLQNFESPEDFPSFLSSEKKAQFYLGISFCKVYDCKLYKSFVTDFFFQGLLFLEKQYH